MGSAGTDEGGEPSGGGIARRAKPRNRLVEWVLVDGNRILLTLVLSGVVFASLVAFHRLGVIAFTNDDSITRMGSGMIAGSFSLVTLVVSVNQLILSQEFSPAGKFRDRLEGVLEFRRDVEEVASIPAAPAEPTRLLELLSANIRHRANVLADTIDDHTNKEYRNQTVRFARSVEDSTQRIDERLDAGNVRAFDALRAATEYDDSWQLYATRHLRNDAPALSEEVERSFDDLIEALRLFGTAQEHFKTIYLQRELTRFSQLTIFCGVPAIGAAVLVVLLYGGIGGVTLRITYYPYLIPFLTTVVFVPVGLLTSYILRTATLARRTAAIGAMLPQKDPDEGPFEVSYGDTE